MTALSRFDFHKPCRAGNALLAPADRQIYVAVKIAAIALLLVLFTDKAFATPAPWYRWRSLLDGSTLCAQTSPGAGWERVGGPFRNAACR